MVNKVLVLGATGGTGQVMVNELVQRGITVKVFGRTKSKLSSLWPNLESATGDVFKVDDIISAGQDVDLIVQCAAIPYHETVARQIPLAQSVMAAAKALHTKVAFVDGIYAYGKGHGKYVTENAPLRPMTRKGHTKAALSRLLFDETNQSVPVALFRLPDYFGPSAGVNTYLGSTLIGITRHQPTVYIGPKNVEREFVYLPDAAKMMTNIALDDNAYNQVWNIPGQRITGQSLIKLAKHIAHEHQPVLTMTKSMLKLSGLFNADMKEMVEMYPLTQHPLYLAGTKYEQHYGHLIETPFETSMASTIEAIHTRN
ncbi:NAD-dependent epimerase/dehydratase family protein [Furfurilactobacillus milii]|uniref:NAD-dependent epimerase/dehydratase family protein n=1 Tax=Furfurilactobacillus rossiae TaxID=231049 RepID=A0A7C9MU04_9LACO|nr:NAD-dependent epimerase/dehydratase family protein [Furfurilactobacillus milii]MYV06128.1 NAD-dependent epimerase/dehydratase family protein [Furfurilactobacillus milii]